jgi:uncharacterized protein
MPAPVRVLVLALTAVLVAGCGITIETGTGDGSPTGTARPESGTGAGAEGDDLPGDEQDAVEAIDAFWQRTFPDTFGRSYRSPQVRGGYQGENGPTCGGQPSVAFNAFYCPSQDFLAWDDQLMSTGYERIGDAWVYLIIAHEWGHAIQARLQRDQVSPAAELQADCLAGATLFGAADLGLLTIERGDTQELSETLQAVADDYPWTEESDHGDARQRTAAFSRGAQDGVESCVA